MDIQVLVVGAGPTGLTLACGLAQRGIGVRVVDAADGPASTSRALGLQPRGAEVLDRIDALRDLPQLAIQGREVTVHPGGGRPLVVPIGRVVAPGQLPTMLISQAVIEGRLRERLAEHGVKVEWGHRLIGFEQDATGVTATIEADGERTTARAGWLAGCDGGHSVVRKLTGVGFPGNPVLENVLLADVRADWPIARTGSNLYAKDGKEWAALPLPGGIWRVFTHLHGEIGDDAYAAARTQLREVGCPMMGVAPETVRSIEWASIFRVQERLVDRYRFDRVLLAGDAAHLHSPTGGQGMNTGMGDAENLAWKLALVATGRARAALLDTYEAERRPVAQAVLAATTAATRILFAGGRLTRLIRAAGAALLAVPAVQKAVWLQGSGLKISYRGGPLAAPGRFGAGPRPGDRAPNIACFRADGSRTTLRAAVTGGTWALLDADALQPVAQEALGGPVVALRPASGTLTDAVLVRPDGHVGWRGEPAASALKGWLSDVVQVA